LQCQSLHPVKRKFDLWPWPIFGSFMVNTCYRNLSPLSMSPLSLCGKKVWPLTLTQFWVIQGQHSCYSIFQVFTDVILKWQALGRKASIFDPPLPLSQDPISKFWNLSTYVQDIAFQVLEYCLTTPKILSRVAVISFITEHIIFCPLGPIWKFRNLTAYLQDVTYHILKDWFAPSWNVGGVRGQRNEKRKTDGRTEQGNNNIPELSSKVRV
jgi:hypothetical protein